MRRMLEDAGHTVIGEAATADEVFDLAQGPSADVVLLDIRMPGMDTLQAARSLAKDQSMPVVFVSAFIDPDMVARATETGAFAYA
ncbi:MAG TPA: response regulator [bacterium]|nr:response regulator [bacterium]